MAKFFVASTSSTKYTFVGESWEDVFEVDEKGNPTVDEHGEAVEEFSVVELDMKNKEHVKFLVGEFEDSSQGFYNEEEIEEDESDTDLSIYISPDDNMDFV